MKSWIMAGMMVAMWAMCAPAAPPEPVKGRSALADEIVQVEREIALRMMRRADLAPDKRPKNDLETDVRIILRALLIAANDAKAESDQQAAAWLRAKQMYAVIRGLEDALAQEGLGSSQTQKDALMLVRRLSFNAGELKKDASLDDFCRQVALAVVNVVNATPVDSKMVVAMRPKPLAVPHVDNRERPPTAAELGEQVHKLAALSVPLRQQLLALAQAAASDSKDSAAMYAMLNQSVALARGLHGNTAVTPEARTTIETQLAEGLALYSDPRMRDAGKARVEALGQYRAILGRIGKMGLSAAQMDQLSPALAWAQANPESGGKLLATLEQYIDLCGRWDALPTTGVMPPPLKKPLDDLVAQFAKQRSEFMQDASRIGGRGSANLGELESHIDEMKRLLAVTEDLRAAGPSMDHLNGFKLKPVGALEKKVKIAADAAASPTKGPNRNDADKYLNALHNLADLSQALAAKPLNDVPANIAATWAGGKVSTFEARWQGIIIDLANSLVTGSLELDRAKVARLETAMAMGDALRMAVQLDAALAKAPVLARWADWSIDPATLNAVMGTYREALSGAFAGYAADNTEAVDRWNRSLSRYFPLIVLVTRDAAYAEACQSLPIGLGADIARLATRFEGEPFATERFVSYAISLWTIHERAGDTSAADRISTLLSQRISRDLHLGGGPVRGPRRPRN